ncbi:hypothetical protein E2562_023895 [Oryza meyeriana var. granulata]|uniref:Uncharacterized protein n=1 Tax=Oryza meyeriana var. granulata TaxID=110450 RepID=A0A6G1D6B2_9ORYZ|nr:hypothetical protein E2562_023895 [Oryza meyeriana var. granulata]
MVVDGQGDDELVWKEGWSVGALVELRMVMSRSAGEGEIRGGVAVLELWVGGSPQATSARAAGRWCQAASRRSWPVSKT